MLSHEFKHQQEGWGDMTVTIHIFCHWLPPKLLLINHIQKHIKINIESPKWLKQYVLSSLPLKRMEMLLLLKTFDMSNTSWQITKSKTKQPKQTSKKTPTTKFCKANKEMIEWSQKWLSYGFYLQRIQNNRFNITCFSK